MWGCGAVGLWGCGAVIRRDARLCAAATLVIDCFQSSGGRALSRISHVPGLVSSPGKLIK